MVETSFKNIIRGRISQPAGKRFLHKTETDTFCALFDVVHLTFFIWISPTSFWIQIDCFLQFYDQIPPSDHQQLFLQPCKSSVHQFFFLVMIFSYLVLTSLALDCTDYRTGSDELHASRPWIFRWISIHLYPIWFLTNSTKHKLQQLCTKVAVPSQKSSLQNRIGVCPSCKDWEVVMKILKRWHFTRNCNILESQYWKVAIVNMMCLLSCNTSPYLTWEVCLWQGNRTGILNSGNEILYRIS